MASPNLVVDTNVFIEFLRAKDKTATVLFSLPSDSKLYISAVTLYELLMGATNDSKKHDVELLTAEITILPFNTDVAQMASIIYHDMKKSNQLIEFRDIFIGATCIAYDYPLITINKKHFNRIKNIRFA